MQGLTNKTQLYTLLEQGAVAISPNNRLSNALIEDYFHDHKKPTQIKPEILPYPQFLIQCYRAQIRAGSPVLISPAQNMALWQEILERQDEIPLNQSFLTRILTAWQHCQQWQLSLDNPAFQQTAQTRAFQTWALKYTQTLKEKGLLAPEQIPAYLMQQPWPDQSQKTYLWLCFDDFTPEQISLQKQLDTLGARQYRYDLKTEKPNQVYVFKAQDEEEEYQQLFLWLKEKLKEKKPRIGVVVPNLTQIAEPLQRRCEQALPAESYNLSYGRPLSQFPLVAHALHWLELDKKYLSNHEARLLLYSPYLAGSRSEFLARMQVMQDSQLLEHYQISKHGLIRELGQPTPVLAQTLEQVQAFPRQASPQTWVQHFIHRWQQLGFPGEYGLDSANYQIYQRLLNALDEFRQLEIVSPSLSKAKALSLLGQIANQTVFQIKSPRYPIQICGLLEASGSDFDALWIVGLSDDCLPQAVKLNPFIPKTLQKEYAMPHSLAERELSLAQSLISRFKNAASEVIFSFPAMRGDKPNLASPLIKGLPAFEPLIDNQPAAKITPLVCLEESYLLPLTDNEKPQGGTSILSEQAKCPFRAFAKSRLLAKGQDLPSDGLDHKDRGTLLHKALELLWRELASQEKLLALDESTLTTLVTRIVRQAVQALDLNLEQQSNDFVQAVEIERLTQLILRYLDLERLREPFVIDALEQSYAMNLAGLELKVRIDRMDRDLEGNKQVIDYKTTLPTSTPWEEERPQEPQMLLYALLDETIRTLSFMQVKAGEIKTRHFSDNNLPKNGPQTWSEYRQLWQQRLDKLAEEFLQGHCPPQPFKKATCTFCDFKSLCRFRWD